MNKILVNNKSIRLTIDEDVLDRFEFIDIYDLDVYDDAESFEEYEEKLLNDTFEIADHKTPIYWGGIKDEFNNMDDADINRVIYEYGIEPEDVPDINHFRQRIVSCHIFTKVSEEIHEALENIEVNEFNEDDYYKIYNIIWNYLRMYRGGIIGPYVQDVQEGNEDAEESKETLIRMIMEGHCYSGDNNDNLTFAMFEEFESRLNEDPELHQDILNYEL